MSAPGFWMDETSGVLRPAVWAYLRGEPMLTEHIVALRAYLRQWILGDWQGPEIAARRREVELLTTREEIDRWIDRAVAIGIDPL